MWGKVSSHLNFENLLDGSRDFYLIFPQEILVIISHTCSSGFHYSAPRVSYLVHPAIILIFDA